MTTPSPLQLEAEQIYPYEFGVEIETTDAQRAAHIAAAEKYTAIIDRLSKYHALDIITTRKELTDKHHEELLSVTLECQKKDQEIERLRQKLEIVFNKCYSMGFPYTAYKDNEAACVMAIILNEIGEITTQAKTPTP